MTPEKKEILRNEILCIVNSAAPNCVTLRLLESYLRGFRLGQTQQDVEAELHYLTGKGLLALVPKLISPENRAWTITADGTDYLATTGLI